MLSLNFKLSHLSSLLCFLLWMGVWDTKNFIKQYKEEIQPKMDEMSSYVETCKTKFFNIKYPLPSPYHQTLLFHSNKFKQNPRLVYHRISTNIAWKELSLNSEATDAEGEAQKRSLPHWRSSLLLSYSQKFLLFLSIHTPKIFPRTDISLTSCPSFFHKKLYL